MPMKKIFVLNLFAVAVISISCNVTVNQIFGKKTPHEKYGDKVEETSLGQQWLAVSKDALNKPLTIKLPYRHLGYFQIDKPRALALEFKATRGERINFDLIKKTGTGFVVYADLFRQNASGVSHLLAADTTVNNFSIDISETGSYILRLQPELYRTGEYSLAASVAPSLGFPVTGNRAKVSSFWGDPRDGGQRRHEGIDIFAPKLTPAIAAADGYVSGVTDGGIGGKTVWLNVAGKNIHLYYAHLDRQLVRDGQVVKKGDTLGLIGNTGNAKYTAPHLHFGIYTPDGPVDPFPFVNKIVKTAPALAAKEFTPHSKLSPSGNAKNALKPNTDELLVPLAFTANGYIVEDSNGSILQVPATAVKPIKIFKEARLRAGS